MIIIGTRENFLPFTFYLLSVKAKGEKRKARKFVNLEFKGSTLEGMGMTDDGCLILPDSYNYLEVEV